MTEGVSRDSIPANAESLGVVVVSVDPTRLGQYRAALRMAGVTAALTADADEAETWLRERLPTSLVLDQGLPRMTVFRLYGLVRAEESMRDIAVLFVGQEGQGSAEDHYLPSDASPLAVAARAQQLANRHTTEAAAETETSTSDLPDWGAPADRAQIASPPPWSPPVQPVVDVNPVPVIPARHLVETAEEPAEAEIAPPAPRGRRLDLILFYAGIVLLVLGLAAVFLTPMVTSQLQAPPVTAPVTPARPSASPSPAALTVPALSLEQAAS